jgi:hypothetical protein
MKTQIMKKMLLGIVLEFTEVLMEEVAGFY